MCWSHRIRKHEASEAQPFVWTNWGLKHWCRLLNHERCFLRLDVAQPGHVFFYTAMLCWQKKWSPQNATQGHTSRATLFSPRRPLKDSSHPNGLNHCGLQDTIQVTITFCTDVFCSHSLIPLTAPLDLSLFCFPKELKRNQQ